MKRLTRPLSIRPPHPMIGHALGNIGNTPIYLECMRNRFCSFYRSCTCTCTAGASPPRTCPLPIPVMIRMVRSSHQRMNRGDTLHSCCRLLRCNPAVPDELTCQLPTEYNQCWAASNRTFCESKVPKSQERIHLGDSQNKQEHSYLPSLGGPTVLN